MLYETQGNKISESLEVYCISVALGLHVPPVMQEMQV